MARAAVLGAALLFVACAAEHSSASHGDTPPPPPSRTLHDPSLPTAETSAEVSPSVDASTPSLWIPCARADFQRGGSFSPPPLPIQDCRTAAGPRGAGHASMTFSADGSLIDVALVGPFNGTSEGACIERRIRSLRVCPFTGGAQTIGKSFVVN